MSDAGAQWTRVATSPLHLQYPTDSTVADQTYTKVTPIKWQGVMFDPGLRYDYYEGTWRKLPDFSVLKPVASGVTQSITLDVRKRDDNFGLVFSGYFRIPKGGTYLFFTKSDDGSKFFIDNLLVVNNDAGGGIRERRGGVKIKAGLYPIKVVQP